jgi:hypothetical protein
LRQDEHSNAKSPFLYLFSDPVVAMLRENRKWKTHEHESTDVAHRGRAARRNDEVSVMEME